MSALPKCPLPDHGERDVVRDGTYGRRKRQRFRCWSPDRSEFHRFTPAVPRQRIDTGVCETCDNHINVHEGPVVMRYGLYEIREIAEALVAVARGSSYTEASRRARGRYWGTTGKTTRGAGSVEGGQTVADWLNMFGPIVIAANEETAWPECIVLDSTEFMHTNPKVGVPEQLFVVMAAWGYDADGSSRLWRVEARPSDKNSDWCEFLEGLPGRPRSVVCDRDYAIIGGVQLRWGRGKAAVPIHLCEHHLRENAMNALRADKVAAYGDPLPTLLRSAFSSLADWDAFDLAVHADPSAVSAQRWVRHWDKRMRVQTARRPMLPPHFGNGAVEAPLAEIRQLLERRKWTFRNRARMNILLGVIRLRLNRHDDIGRWSAAIRDHLEQHGGRPENPRRIEDPRIIDPTTGERYYSLRG